jgi:undecaprenyl-diphosphatase
MDASLYRAVNRLAQRTGWLHPAATAFAKYGIALFAGALLVAWWQARQREGTTSVAAVVCAVAAVFAALGAAQLVGHAVGRARPYDAIASVRVLVPRTRDFSFPSDHATVAGAVAAGLWLVDRRLGRLVAGLAVVMALSRVYVGAHYPGDVVAGLALGAAAALAVNRLAARRVARPLARLARSPLGPLIAAGERPGTSA